MSVRQVVSDMAGKAADATGKAGIAAIPTAEAAEHVGGLVISNGSRSSLQSALSG